jgi:hypothetical protein
MAIEDPEAMADAFVNAVRHALKHALPPLNKKIQALEARVAELEARPELRYLGIHEEGKEYRAGSAVTLGGSVWIAEQRTRATPGDPAPASRAWRLAVQRGRPGRDAR